MSRYFYIGLLAVVAVGITALFSYRTSTPSAELVDRADFGGVSLRIEYATTSTALLRGLGGRDSIADDYGMLFVFPNKGNYGFWMKNMLVPIDIFWLNDKGQVVSITQNIAASSYPDVFYPSEPVRYVLETDAGFANEHSIATGTPLLLKNFPIVSE